LPTSREADGHHAGKAARAVAQIQTGKLTHNPENASIEVIDGALWLEVDAEIGQHVNYRLIDNEPIALDDVFIYSERPAAVRARVRRVSLDEMILATTLTGSQARPIERASRRSDSLIIPAVTWTRTVQPSEIRNTFRFRRRRREERIAQVVGWTTLDRAGR
jgi:hypothetical protein